MNLLRSTHEPSSRGPEIQRFLCRRVGALRVSGLAFRALGGTNQLNPTCQTLASQIRFSRNLLARNPIQKPFETDV